MSENDRLQASTGVDQAAAWSEIRTATLGRLTDEAEALRSLDDLDRTYLDLLASAVAGLAVLDCALKYRLLTESESARYARLVGLRGHALDALGFEMVFPLQRPN